MTCTMRKGAPRWGWTSGLLLAAAAFSTASPVRAQTCDDDGGMVCVDEDAGADDDGGVDRAGSGGAGAGGMSGGGGGGARDAGPSDRDACSCEAEIDDPEQGRIHVCTQSDTVSGCRGFSCERGVVQAELCPSSNVELCCVMEQRDLVSVLYADCTHPNCVAGLKQQCADFEGALRSGNCSAFIDRGTDDHDHDGGGCAAARAVDGSQLAGLALGVLGLIAARRRRHRTRDGFQSGA